MAIKIYPMSNAQYLLNIIRRHSERVTATEESLEISTEKSVGFTRSSLHSDDIEKIVGPVKVLLAHVYD